MSVVIMPIYCLTEEMQDMTDKCIDTMMQTAGHRIGKLIIVDDGSPVTRFRENTIFRKENGGYPAAVNTGLSSPIWFGADIIVCNNDIEFIQEDWIEHLLKPLGMGYGVSSIRTTDSNGWDVEEKITENDKFGSIWAMSHKVFSEVGLLDERYGKGYYEDLDYWRRVQDAGFKIAKNHAGLVHHIGKATFDVIDPNDKLYERNMFLYKQKWGDKAHLFETAPNSILLVDDYEITDEQREIARKRGISLEEAERRWGIKL